mmetsp:Transcript_23599/g.32212  ORF Transcript_23599/g.32212 Transcript_23599/m.32212 type:complete len:263 (-) Transcript_23599:816-1604(-)
MATGSWVISRAFLHRGSFSGAKIRLRHRDIWEAIDHGLVTRLRSTYGIVFARALFSSMITSKRACMNPDPPGCFISASSLRTGRATRSSGVGFSVSHVAVRSESLSSPSLLALLFRCVTSAASCFRSDPLYSRSISAMSSFESFHADELGPFSRVAEHVRDTDNIPVTSGWHGAAVSSLTSSAVVSSFTSSAAVSSFTSSSAAPTRDLTTVILTESPATCTVSRPSAPVFRHTNAWSAPFSRPMGFGASRARTSDRPSKFTK